jgi:hypothetical protein
MEERQLAAVGGTQGLRRYAASALRGERAGHAAHGRPMESVRVAEHGGHRITIRTRYTIEVDGRPLRTHLVLDNDGQLACHALPNYAFGSAVDLVKHLIDQFPADFARPHVHRSTPRRPARRARRRR